MSPATERLRWFWILSALCFVASIGLGVYSVIEPTNVWPWHYVVILILFFGAGFSLIPLAWFVLPDVQMHRAWVLLVLVHPLLLVVPVLIGKKAQKKSASVAS